MRPLLPIALLLLASPASGDELLLRDGRRVAGPLLSESETGLEILTLSGPVRVDRDTILARRSEEALRARLEATIGRGNRSPRRLLLAVREALRLGLFEEAWDLADRARLDGLPASLLPGDLARAPLARDLVDPLDDEGVRRLVAIASEGGPARRERARARLAADLDPRRHRHVLRLLLEGQDRKARRVLLAALPGEVLEPLSATLRRLVWRADDPPDVRALAAHRAREVVGDPILADVAAALEVGDRRTRSLALDAAEAIASRRLAGALVRHLRRAAEGKVRRASIRFGEETSYVRDFDVEVAQAAATARPRVGVVRHGSVLDVGIAGVSERRIPREEKLRCARLLERLTGERFGPDWRRWDTWLRSR